MGGGPQFQVSICRDKKGASSLVHILLRGHFMTVNIIGRYWEPNHKHNFCYPPDWWLLGSEMSGAGLYPGGADLLGNNPETDARYWPVS